MNTTMNRFCAVPLVAILLHCLLLVLPFPVCGAEPSLDFEPPPDEQVPMAQKKKKSPTPVQRRTTQNAAKTTQKPAKKTGVQDTPGTSRRQAGKAAVPAPCPTVHARGRKVRKVSSPRVPSPYPLPEPGTMQWTEPVTGMIFVWVPEGCYDMGCRETSPEQESG